MLSAFYKKIWEEAYERNTSNINLLLEPDPNATVLDVGCGDGKKTEIFKKKIRVKKITGIDNVSDRLKAAKARGIDVVLSDLEKKWPFPDSYFDVVISNQVIEHVSDIDLFISETYRLLKPRGYTVISTENLSSWHNVFALILGYQDFSHHILKKSHAFNPFSLHYGEKTVTWSKKDNSGTDDTAYPHLKILTYRSLKKAFEIYNFKFEKGLGSGYYPLFGIFSELATKIDPYHSHFISLKMRKQY